MPVNPFESKSRGQVGKQKPTPPRQGKRSPEPTATRGPRTSDGKLPHERDQSAHTTAEAPDPVIAQAKRDLDGGLVDTDMRATPGLDSRQRADLVPGAGGVPLSKRA